MEEMTSPLPVSRLVDLLRETVEDNFFRVAVEGEISNFSSPSSGHLYFTLKDASAQLRAVMFRGSTRMLQVKPADGMQVVCRGRITIYPQRGDVQMIVESLEGVGAGDLQRTFEQLKQKLDAEGLFAADRKKPLPAWPQVIGVVTSSSGAAIHDILHVLERRGVGVTVRLCPVRVQGEDAALEIASAIGLLNGQPDIDVLIVGRGGGSLEDLWAFNEEPVARAIAASRLPVISAVGHEIDVSIADFVSDLRAATPTAAAELVAKSRLELEAHLDRQRMQLASQMRQRLQSGRLQLSPLQRRLVSPQMQLALRRQQVVAWQQRLGSTFNRYLDRQKTRTAGFAGRLDALSPLRTLERGYAIALRESDGTAVHDASTLAAGDRLQLRLEKGAALVVVDEVQA